MTRLPSTIRQQVRQRADERCEYCGLPEGFVTFGHQVDHVVPPRHGGSDDLENLAWACFQCNNRKGTDIASFDLDTGEPTLLYNPREQRWDDHFAIEEAVIVGKTPVGRATARLLQMNSPKRVETRRNLFEAGYW